MSIRPRFADGEPYVAANLLPAPVPPPTSAPEWPTVFTLTALRAERPLLELLGFQDPASPTVRVLAAIRHVNAVEERPPQQQLYEFPDRKQADRFVQDTLLCFEYLGCTVSRD